MHHVDLPTTPSGAAVDSRPWYKTLTGYHWFVLTVAALGWLFDCLDQQLFTLARPAVMKDIITNVVSDPPNPAEDRRATNERQSFYGNIATSIFIAGWACGGLIFGVLGDRIGRARTMLLTILLYSIFTGLSALSVGFVDFALYRFLTGLGVGGEFAVGVALVAEVMPTAARSHCLALLQALSAFGNISASFINLGLGMAHEEGLVSSPWRIMFVIGAAPALLALFIRSRLREPEAWQKISHDDAVKKQLGSYSELFSTPLLRKHAILGLILGCSGIIGLWSVGFFTPDLSLRVFRSQAAAEVHGEELEQASPGQKGNVEEVMRIWAEQKALDSVLDKLTREVNVDLAQVESLLKKKVAADELYSSKVKDAIVHLRRESEKKLTSGIKPDTPLAKARDEYRKGELSADGLLAQLSSMGYSSENAAQTLHVIDLELISQRMTRKIGGRLTRWQSYVLLMQNIGAACGMIGFGALSYRIGRKPTFAICFLAAFASTAVVFWTLSEFWQIFVLVPIMGFCQLSLFAGYAIYFPELFPTRLRSTGTSFCYNVGRFVAATGPLAKAFLESIFKDTPEPLRYAGVTMCVVFLLGLLVLPFLPETRGKPLPE